MRVFTLCVISIISFFIYCTDNGVKSNKPVNDLTKMKQDLLKDAGCFQDSVYVIALFQRPSTKEELIRFLKEDHRVRNAYKADNNIIISYTNGTEGTILFVDDRKIPPIVPVIKQEPSAKRVKKALLITPFIDDWSGGLTNAFVEGLKTTLRTEYVVDHFTKGYESVAAYKTINNYKLIYIGSHGVYGYSPDRFYFLTSMLVSMTPIEGEDRIYYHPFTIARWLEIVTLNFKEIFKSNRWRTKWGLSSVYFQVAEGKSWFDSSLVILNCCNSMKGDAVPKQMLITPTRPKGALAVCGWSKLTEEADFVGFNTNVLDLLLKGSNGTAFQKFKEIDQEFCYKIASVITQKDYYLIDVIKPPINVQAQGGNKKITVTWQSNPPALSYNLYWSTNPNVTKLNNKISNVTSPFIHEPVTNGSTRYYVITNLDQNSFESYPSLEVSATAKEIADKLVAYWSFDEGSGNIANDQSSNGFHGTLHGDPEWVSGVKGKALKFDGVDDYLVASQDIILSDDFTIMFNIKFDEMGTSSKYVLAKHKIQNNFMGGWAVLLCPTDSLPDNSIWFNSTPAGTNNYKGILIKGIDYKVSTWHHLKINFDDASNIYNVYFDNVNIKTGVLDIDIKNSSSPFQIGAAYSGYVLSYAKFTIDEVKFYSNVQ